MEVFTIGNVTQCNKAYIFLNDDGRQRSIKATDEALQRIYKQANEDERFYTRMYNETQGLYEKKKEEFDKKYKYISDEAIQETYRQDHDKGFRLKLEQPHNNEEWLRQWGRVSGIADAQFFAGDKMLTAHKLMMQAKNALQERSKQNGKIKHIFD